MFSNKNPQKVAKNRKKYLCDKCDYTTSNLFDFNKHNLTIKHQILENQPISNNLATEKSPNKYECKKCNKTYNDRSGLWRHNKKCVENENGVEVEQCDKPMFTNEMVYEILKELSNANAQNAEFQAKLVDFMKDGPITNITNITNNNGNTNNVQINIDTFLNQYCKDAIPMNEFIKNIKVTNEDVFNMAKNGNKNGVIAVVTRVMNELKLIERSFHCTDAKRHTTYIKEEAGWKKTQDQKDLMRLCFYIGDKCFHKSADIRNSDPKYMQSGTEETVILENIYIETCGGKLGFEHNNALAANWIESKYHIDKKEMLEAIAE